MIPIFVSGIMCKDTEQNDVNTASHNVLRVQKLLYTFTSYYKHIVLSTYTLVSDPGNFATRELPFSSLGRVHDQ